MSIKVRFAAVIAALLLVTSCSSESTSNNNQGGSGLGSATTVQGTVFAANGSDPISGATVYIPGTASSGLTAADSPQKIVQTDCGSAGGTVSCDDPPEASCAQVCSCADGSYTLDVSSCDTSSGIVFYKKGSFTGQANLDCTTDPCSVDIAGGVSSTAKIAVVTGAFDEIEDVLAKLGFGDVAAAGELNEGKLVIGTESFTIFRGGGPRDFELSSADPDGDKYLASSALFNDLDLMNSFDIIFVNCGTTESVASALTLQQMVVEKGTQAAHAHYHATQAITTPTIQGNIRSFVDGGGVFYATDLAYDFIEQSIPEFMKFEGDPDDAATAGSTNAAQLGDSGIISDADVKNAGMNSWITASTLTTNTIDSATSPNGGSCATTLSGNSGSSNLNGDGTIRIGDFLSGWGLMNSTHDAETFVWIEGPVTWSFSESGTRPLTASRKVGSGCVLYSSYHTSHSCPTTGFWPQERVLQYLVFETGDTCTP